MHNKSVDQLSDLSNKLLRFIWQHCPVEATILGIHDYDDTFGDQSADAYRRHGEEYGEFILSLQTCIDPEDLNQDQLIDYELCMALASRGSILSTYQRHWNNNPDFYVWMAVWGCFIFLFRNNMPIEERLLSAIGRMREIPDLLQAARSNISNPPSGFVTTAIQSIAGGLPVFKKLIPRLAEHNPTLRQELLSLSASTAEALEDFSLWLQTDILPNVHGDFAIGRYAYEQLTYSEHRLTYSPQELVLLACSVLQETEEEIAKVAKMIDPSADWRELIARLKHDHPPKEFLLEAYRKAIDSAKQFVIDRDLVTIPDGESLEVMWTPEIERSLLPYAAYFPPAVFGTSKAAGFWVTPVNSAVSPEQQESQLLGHSVYSIPVIALHEAYPGHHVQITRQIDVRSPLAKQMMSSLLMEGWTLYCEQMMYEQGFYTDPRIRLFQLKDLLWRAVRVIVDVGLHTEGMSCEEGVHLLVDKACFEEVNAIAEVRRYALYPTQPMTYLLGKLLVTDLRSRMKAQLGNAFDLKAFHDQLISYGSVPIPLIANHMLAHPAVKARHLLLRTA